MKRAQDLMDQVRRVVIGKDDIIQKVFTAMLAGGHILLEDIPGVGKTTMSMAFAKAMDISYKRMQFTPDVMPTDVTGYTIYNKQEGKNVYVPGAAMCNLFLADEINRTSSKTQSALLEVMEEGAITVDGVTRPVPQPFLVIATQNPVGSAGTQLLPESQMDRFMICLSMGYPDRKSEVQMLKQKAVYSLNDVQKVLSPEQLLIMQRDAQDVYASDALLDYIASLTQWTRRQPSIYLGVSPRGSLALLRMAKAYAYLQDRDYLIPQDVQSVFADVCAHRLLLSSQARMTAVDKQSLLRQAIAQVRAPSMV